MNCEGCRYWQKLNGTDGTMACHYLLQEGHSRKRDGDKCLSRKTKREQRKRDWPFPAPVEGTSVGYKNEWSR